MRVPRYNAWLGVFSIVELDGPLRTAPEPFPLEGGCPAINPRHRTPWWRRWWVAQDRLHRRWAARRLWLMAHAGDLGLTVPKAAALLPIPIWRTR